MEKVTKTKKSHFNYLKIKEKKHLLKERRYTQTQHGGTLTANLKQTTVIFAVLNKWIELKICNSTVNIMCYQGKKKTIFLFCFYECVWQSWRFSLLHAYVTVRSRFLIRWTIHITNSMSEQFFETFLGRLARLELCMLLWKFNVLVDYACIFNIYNSNGLQVEPPLSASHLIYGFRDNAQDLGNYVS